VASFTLRPVDPRESDPEYPFDRGSRTGLDVAEKKLAPAGRLTCHITSTHTHYRLSYPGSNGNGQWYRTESVDKNMKWYFVFILHFEKFVAL